MIQRAANLWMLLNTNTLVVVESELL